MTRSDDVINEDGHDVIATHTRVVRGMAAALAAIAATGAGVTAAAANVMFTFALDTKAWGLLALVGAYTVVYLRGALVQWRPQP